MNLFFWLLLTCYFHDAYAQWEHNLLKYYIDDITIMARLLSKNSRDILKDGGHRVTALYKIRQDNQRSAPYEIGYLVMAVQENYRKMLDKYHVYGGGYANIYDFYFVEIVMFLEEIERYFWQIEHLINMMHEIERKYKVKSKIDEEYVDPDSNATITTLVPPHPPPYKTKADFPKPKQIKAKDAVANWLAIDATPKRLKTDLPREYGWDLYEWSSNT